MITFQTKPKGAARNRILYVSWAPDCSRSDHTARELGANSHMVYAAALGSRPATILLKYLVQWWRTSRLLARERPDVVFVMSPPIIAALPAWWYALRRGKQFVLDAHTCAFVLPRWRLFQGLQRALMRRAATTLVTNEHIANLVRSARAHATLVPDVPIIFERTEVWARTAQFCVAVVCSHTSDEPIAEVLEAARQLPDVAFYVTGDTQALESSMVDKCSENVMFTGYLSVAAYGGLIGSVDTVLDLTTLDHTMLRGAFEAIYQGVPVVISDWPLLRAEFPIGAIHVHNTAPAIAAAVRAMRADVDRFKAEAKQLRVAKLTRWPSIKTAILSQLR